MLEERIGELWEEAARLALPVVAHRKPGVPADFLERAFDQRIPSEVATWFASCDGVDQYPGQTQNDAALVPGYEPLSVDQSVAIQREQMSEPLLRPTFFPLIGAGGGDFYAVSYDPETQRSSVVSVVIGEETRIAYRSVDQMVETLVQCYREGIFFVDDDGVLQADDELWIQKEYDALGISAEE